MTRTLKYSTWEKVRHDVFSCIAKYQVLVAFFSTEAPQSLNTPLPARAPEDVFNRLSTLLKITYSARIDVWSLGCLVRLHKSALCYRPDVQKVYELATSRPLIGYVREELKALNELTSLLGPIPQEWVGSLGT